MIFPSTCMSAIDLVPVGIEAGSGGRRNEVLFDAVSAELEVSIPSMFSEVLLVV